MRVVHVVVAFDHVHTKRTIIIEQIFLASLSVATAIGVNFDLGAVLSRVVGNGVGWHGRKQNVVGVVVVVQIDVAVVALHAVVAEPGDVAVVDDREPQTVRVDLVESLFGINREVLRREVVIGIDLTDTVRVDHKVVVPVLVIDAPIVKLLDALGSGHNILVKETRDHCVS